MLRKESSVPIGCNISSSPRLIDVLLSLDVHVVQKVMWAGIHRDWRGCRTLSNNQKLCLECFNSRATGTLYRRTQGSSLTGSESSCANQRARCFTGSEKLAWQSKHFRTTLFAGSLGVCASSEGLGRIRCKGFAQAPCPVSRPTGRVHIIGHQSRLHRTSIQSTRISELDGVQSGVKESVRH